MENKVLVFLKFNLSKSFEKERERESVLNNVKENANPYTYG